MWCGMQWFSCRLTIFLKHVWQVTILASFMLYICAVILVRAYGKNGSLFQKRVCIIERYTVYGIYQVGVRNAPNKTHDISVAAWRKIKRWFSHNALRLRSNQKSDSEIRAYFHTWLILTPSRVNLSCFICFLRPERPWNLTFCDLLESRGVMAPGNVNDPYHEFFEEHFGRLSLIKTRRGVGW